MNEYLIAFDLLSSRRQYGMGPNPIPLSEILAYIQFYGVEDSEAFIEYITKMDASYLSTRAQLDKKEAEAKAKANQVKSKQKR